MMLHKPGFFLPELPSSENWLFISVAFHHAKEMADRAQVSCPHTNIPQQERTRKAKNSPNDAFYPETQNIPVPVIGQKGPHTYPKLIPVS